jgi:death-on-curing protein
MYTFLAINGARLTADAQETYLFVAALYEANQFSFDKLVPWLRSHVTQDPPADPPR